MHLSHRAVNVSFIPCHFASSFCSVLSLLQFPFLLISCLFLYNLKRINSNNKNVISKESVKKQLILYELRLYLGSDVGGPNKRSFPLLTMDHLHQNPAVCGFCLHFIFCSKRNTKNVKKINHCWKWFYFFQFFSILPGNPNVRLAYKIQLMFLSVVSFLLHLDVVCWHYTVTQAHKQCAKHMCLMWTLFQFNSMWCRFV